MQKNMDAGYSYPHRRAATFQTSLLCRPDCLSAQGSKALDIPRPWNSPATVRSKGATSKRGNSNRMVPRERLIIPFVRESALNIECLEWFRGQRPQHDVLQERFRGPGICHVRRGCKIPQVVKLSPLKTKLNPVRTVTL